MIGDEAQALCFARSDIRLGHAERPVAGAAADRCLLLSSARTEALVALRGRLRPLERYQP